MSIFRKQQTTTTKNRKIIYTVILVIASPYTVLLSLLFIPYVWGYRLNLGKHKNSVEKQQPTSLEQDINSKFDKLRQSKAAYIVAGLVLMFGAGNQNNYPYKLNQVQAFLLWLLALVGFALLIFGLSKPSKKHLEKNAKKSDEQKT